MAKMVVRHKLVEKLVNIFYRTTEVLVYTIGNVGTSKFDHDQV